MSDPVYGPLKALCEKAASDAFPGRAAIVRPGFIVGPDDPSGRFTYWPVRIDRGGEVLVPGAPSDPIQIIDVRDLGAWLITLVEDNTAGTFNACGPKDRLAWGDVLAACRKATSTANSLTWVPPDWLRRERVSFPIWVPYLGGTRGFHTWSNARAVKAGLKFRPHAETVADTLKWYKSQPEDGRTKLAGPDATREAELLAKWKQNR
jgi:2'-hydroxyisoflavone reductase